MVTTGGHETAIIVRNTTVLALETTTMPRTTGQSRTRATAIEIVKTPEPIGIAYLMGKPSHATRIEPLASVLIKLTVNPGLTTAIAILRQPTQGPPSRFAPDPGITATATEAAIIQSFIFVAEPRLIGLLQAKVLITGLQLIPIRAHNV